MLEGKDIFINNNNNPTYKQGLTTEGARQISICLPIYLPISLSLCLSVSVSISLSLSLSLSSTVSTFSDCGRVFAYKCTLHCMSVLHRGTSFLLYREDCRLFIPQNLLLSWIQILNMEAAECLCSFCQRSEFSHQQCCPQKMLRPLLSVSSGFY